MFQHFKEGLIDSTIKLRRNLIFVERIAFERQKFIVFVSTTLHDWLKNSRPFFIQSEVKSKLLVTHPHAFSRALRQLRFDWFRELSVSFVIGWSDYCGFGFTARD